MSIRFSQLFSHSDFVSWSLRLCSQTLSVGQWDFVSYSRGLCQLVSETFSVWDFVRYSVTQTFSVGLWDFVSYSVTHTFSVGQWDFVSYSLRLWQLVSDTLSVITNWQSHSDWITDKVSLTNWQSLSDWITDFVSWSVRLCQLFRLLFSHLDFVSWSVRLCLLICYSVFVS